MTELTTPLTGSAAATSGNPTVGKINVYDASSGAVSVTLPALSGLRVGARMIVRKTDSSANTVTVSRASSDTFQDGATAVVLTLQGEQAELQVVSISSTKYWQHLGARTPLAALDSRFESLGNKDANSGYAGLNSSGQLTKDTNGNAATATKLATARNLRTDLTSTSTAAFDGSGDATPGVTGALGIANGGTGQTTSAAAITALTGTQTAGRYLRSDGTNAALSTIQASDVPTLNQNTTGSAAKWTTARTLTTSTGNTVTVDGSADVTFVDTTPSTVFVSAIQKPKASTGTTVITFFNLSNPYRIQSSGTQAINDYIEWEVAVRAGTYQFDMHHFPTPSVGIYTLTIDGGSSLGTIDGYAAVTNTNAVGSIGSISIGTSGLHTVRLTMASKNASSSTYYHAILGWSLTRLSA